MQPIEQYKNLYQQLYILCEQNNWGDPFSYARSREIYIAGVLNHRIAETYSGADGFDSDGPCEYKSTISKRINGTYNGISVFPTWQEQENYIINEKIGKYKNHYVARFDKWNIAEIWKLSSTKVLEILLPKIKKAYARINLRTKKDPRIGVSINYSEIKSNGVEIKL